MRVSRLRRLTCTASAFLKRFLPITWVDLKSEYTDFGMRFLKKKKLWSAFPITIIDTSMKILMCFLKIRCQACYQIFLDVCFLNLKFRTHKINLFACVLRAKCSPKISFFLVGFGSHSIPQSPVTVLSRMLSCLIFDQIFIHIHRPLSIKDIKKLSNDLFAELFNLQTL